MKKYVKNKFLLHRFLCISGVFRLLCSDLSKRDDHSFFYEHRSPACGVYVVRSEKHVSFIRSWSNGPSSSRKWTQGKLA